MLHLNYYQMEIRRRESIFSGETNDNAVLICIPRVCEIQSSKREQEGLLKKRKGAYRGKGLRVRIDECVHGMRYRPFRMCPASVLPINHPQKGGLSTLSTIVKPEAIKFISIT